MTESHWDIVARRMALAALRPGADVTVRAVIGGVTGRYPARIERVLRSGRVAVTIDAADRHGTIRVITYPSDVIVMDYPEPPTRRPGARPAQPTAPPPDPTPRLSADIERLWNEDR